MANGNGRLINLPSIIGGIVLLALGASSGMLVSTRSIANENAIVNKSQDKAICSNQDDVKDLKEENSKLKLEVAVLKTKQQTIVDNTKDTKELVEKLYEKLK